MISQQKKAHKQMASSILNGNLGREKKKDGKIKFMQHLHSIIMENGLTAHKTIFSPSRAPPFALKWAHPILLLHFQRTAFRAAACRRHFSYSIA